MMTVEDLRTERVCPRCRYTIYPGTVHEEQVQPKGSNVVVCNLVQAPGVRFRGPLVEVLQSYLDEKSKTQT